MTKSKITLDYFCLKGPYRLAFGYLLVFSIAFIFPIILANVYYWDDLGRSLYGYTEWTKNGRPLASLIGILLSNSHIIIDTSPFIQLVSICILSYVLILFAKKYIPSQSPLVISGIVAFCYVNLNILQNLSFKYDCLGMILSLSLPVALYALPDEMSTLWAIVLSSLTCIGILSLYQASLGAYIGLAVIEVTELLIHQNNIREITFRIGLRILSLLIGCGIYKEIIVSLTVSQTGYAQKHAAVINFFASNGLSLLQHNILNFIQLLKLYAVTLGPVLLTCLIISAGAGLVMISKRSWISSDSMAIKNFGAVLYILISPVLVFFATFISMCFLQSPVMDCRVMLSFSVFTLYIGLILQYAASRIHNFFYVVSFFSLLVTLSFSSAYGNILYREELYTRQIAQHIVFDIDSIEHNAKKSYDKISIAGKSPVCHEYELI